ncbi:hypothetical protein GEU84_005615 [Fertoebacter nigrum]|uniref:Uncharacterized protein n=1 Tax=Fertoeibacter niger TaxID=2656921 RepID=A0A8X8KQA7_9RHOB|nr:hypothetical protein [Fertoeibacter niger]NUB43852.1 hypothetical protein [Fertoeibacter niger]
MNAEWREAFDTTDAKLARVKGLVTALASLAFDHDALSSSDPASAAITAAIDALQMGVGEVVSLRHTE